MYNDPEVSAELHRLADAEPLAPFDTTAVLTRGQRGVRRRRYLTVGGSIAGVAAIALAATLLPGNSQAGEPPVAGEQKKEVWFEAVPGVPRGEASVGQRLTAAEANRRCGVKFNDPKIKLSTPYDGPFSGQALTPKPEVGQRMLTCIVPGGDKPTQALLDQVKKDGVPKDPAAQLRNCSVQAWVDMTGWSVKATTRSSRIEKGYGEIAQAMVIAVSPSGRVAIACEIGDRSIEGGHMRNGTTLLVLDKLRYDSNILTPATKTQPAQHWTGNNIGGNAEGGYDPVAWGRLNGGVTRIQLRMDDKTKLDIPVTDGWFAYCWETGPTKAPMKSFTVTAYDKDGKVVKKLV
ncbi:hypothetical protein ACFTSF_34120 [Kribbella sp. NPDC056951]|uniref:PASTA domain-containing protein n=1 Tax=Kribbella yunnanensis TaxID=190194 RepID=A0ABP4T2M4_9ACTN